MKVLKLNKTQTNNLHYLLVIEVYALQNSETPLDKMGKANLRSFIKIKEMLKDK